MVAQQRELVFRTWGGKRRGAGRPPRGVKAGMSHLARPLLPSRLPLHVTWRMRPDVCNLRTRRCLRVLEPAFLEATKEHFRVVHYVVMGNHIHLLVEAHDRRALSKGMQGLGVRVARGLNRQMRRRGHVLHERFHAHILRTPTEVKRARLYLLQNARKHYGLRGDDWCASQTPLQPPHTYLLRLTC